MSTNLFKFNSQSAEDTAKGVSVVVILVCVLMIVYALQQMMLGKTGCPTIEELQVEQSQLEDKTKD